MEERAHFPDGDRSLVAELAGAHLEEEHGEAHEDQGDDVGDEEGAAAVPVAEVGEPPDVAEPDGEAEAGEEELDGVVPAAAVLAHGGGLGDVRVGEGVLPSDTRLALRGRLAGLPGASNQSQIEEMRMRVP